MQRKQLKVLRAGFMGSVFDLACAVESFASRAPRRRIGGNNNFLTYKNFCSRGSGALFNKKLGF